MLIKPCLNCLAFKYLRWHLNICVGMQFDVFMTKVQQQNNLNYTQTFNN